MLHKTSFGKLLRRFPLTTLCVALIWYLCLFRPPSVDVSSIPGFDKMVHVSMYLGTCSLFWLEYFRSKAVCPAGKLFVVGVLAPVLMSGLIELAQSAFTTYRSADWADFAANSLGVLLAWGGAWGCRAVAKHRRS